MNSMRSFFLVILNGDENRPTVLASPFPDDNLNSKVTVWLPNVTSNLNNSGKQKDREHFFTFALREYKVNLLWIDADIRLSSCGILDDQKQFCDHFDYVCGLKNKISFFATDFRLKISIEYKKEWSYICVYIALLTALTWNTAMLSWNGLNDNR